MRSTCFTILPWHGKVRARFHDSGFVRSGSLGASLVTVGVLCAGLFCAGFLGAFASTSVLAAPPDELATKAVREALGAYLDAARKKSEDPDNDSPFYFRDAGLPGDPLVSPLQHVVRLEPEMATVVNGRIRLVARPLRRIPIDESARVMADLEKLLAEVLKKSSDVHLKERKVAEWVADCTITTGRMVEWRRIEEVPTIELLERVHAYLVWLDREKAWKRENLEDLGKELLLEGNGLGGKMHVSIAPRVVGQWTVGTTKASPWPRPSQEVRDAHRRIEQAMQRLQRAEGQVNRRNLFNDDDFETLEDYRSAVSSFRERVIEKHHASLRELLKKAWYEHIPEGSEKPFLAPSPRVDIRVSLELLEPEDVRKIVGAGMMAAPAPAGVIENKPTPISQSGTDVDGYKFRVLSVDELTRLKTVNHPNLQKSSVPPLPVEAPVARQELAFDLGSFQGGTLQGLTFSPDNRWLVGAGDVLRIWDLATGQVERTLRAGRPGNRATGFRNVAFTPDGRLMLAAMQGTRHRIWAYEMGHLDEVAFTLDGHEEEVRHLVFSDNGRFLVTADVQRQVFLWDWVTQQKVWGYRFQNPIIHLSFQNRFFRGQDISEVLAVDNTLGFCRIPTVESDQENREPDEEDPLITIMSKAKRPGKDAVWGRHSIAVGADTRHVVIGGASDRDGETKSHFWAASFTEDLRQGPDAPHTRKHFDHKYIVLACTISPDGGRCATGDSMGKILVWDLESGNVEHTIVPFGTGNLSVDFGDTENVWLLGRNRYRRNDWRYNHWAPLHLEFDVRRGILSPREPKEPRIQIEHERKTLRFAFDDRVLSVVEDGRVVSSVSLKSKFNWHVYGYQFQKVAGMPDGHGVVVCSEDGIVSCLDPKTLQPRRSFVGHDSRVWNAQASPDGRRLITTGSDGLICVWSLENFVPTWNVAANVNDDDTISYLYPGTSAEDQLALGDRIDKINGFAPVDWMNSPRSHQEPDGPATIDITRDDRRLQVSVDLTDMGDLARPLVSARISESGDEWILWTRGGYFACSPRAGRLLGWVESWEGDRAARFIKGSQILDAKLRPDIVDLTLKLGDEREAERQANAIRNPVAPPPPAIVDAPGANPPSLVVPSPPRVRIVSPSQDSVTVTGEEQITVTAVVVVAAGQRPTVTFRVNDAEFRSRGAGLVEFPVESDLASEIPPAPAGFENVVARETVPLRLGENVIQVLARVGDVESAEGGSAVRVTRRNAPNAVPFTPTLHWCSIGVEKYTGSGFGNLEYAQDDVELVAESLRKRSKRPNFPYGRVEFHRVVDPEATKAGINRLLDQVLAKDLRPGDTVGIHLSAHGTMIPNTDGYALIPFEGNTGMPRTTCIMVSEIAEWSRSLGKKQVRLILFVDTCRAGGIGTIENGEGAAFDREMSGTIFAASGPKQSALEAGAWKHGAFSLALREALENQPLVPQKWDELMRPDRNGDGILDVTELESFLSYRVRALTKNVQCPQYGRREMTVDPKLF